MGPVRVLVVDDQTLFRAGVIELLRGDPRVAVVGQAGDGVEAIRRVRSTHPDVVLMDLRMPRLDGIQATAEIARTEPGVAVLVLTGVQADDLAIEALEAGAAGVIVKDASRDELVAAILGVAAGDQVISRDVGRRVVARAAGHLRGAASRPEGLSERQLQILRLMAAGFAAKQIGRQLGLSEKTIRNQSSLLYAKLRVQDRAQAILYAVRKGLVA